MPYKVLYHVGESVGIKSKGAVGILSVEDCRLVIQGEHAVSISLKSLQSVELFRLHGVGRMLKIVHMDGTLFVSVIRFCLFGVFAVVNFIATGRLKDELQSASRENGRP